MAEEKSGGGGGLTGVVSPKMIKAGDRQVVRVELRPGETTYVSWRKLMKAAERVNVSSASASASLSAPAPDPPPNAHPNLQSCIAPVRTLCRYLFSQRVYLVNAHVWCSNYKVSVGVSNLRRFV